MPLDLIPTEDAAPQDAATPEVADSVKELQTHERATVHRSAKPKKKHRAAKKDDGKRTDTGSGGPPAWAPAHGFRCKQAGYAPGSAAFHDCINSRKSPKHARRHGSH